MPASDANGYDEAVSIWNGFDSTVRGNIGRINVHGYQHSGRRDQLGDLTAAAGRKVWNPEDGESAGSEGECRTAPGFRPGSNRTPR